MPIGFSDLLKTTAQLDNNLTKGIVNTDETYGGVRSKIDNWTDLHLSTFNSGAGRTFQDDGTAASPGHFKPYSSMFYVADGRALVQDNSASSNFIELDASGNFVAAGNGTKYVAAAGTAEPEYYVYIDATAVGGTGTGTDKLPKFTITGSQGGGNSTALPAGYQKLQVLTNAVADPGGSGFNTIIGVDTDLDTSGAEVIDTISLTDGVVVSDITTRNLTLSDLGYTGATDANNFVHPSHNGDDIDIDTTALTGATVISDLDINITTDTLGHVTDANGTVSTRDLTLGDLGFTGDTNAQANVGTDLAIGTNNGTTQQVTSSTGNNVNLVAATASLAGIVTNAAQTFAGNKTFNNNLIVGGNLSVAGTVTQSNSTEVNFNDTRLRLNIPTSLLDGSIENTGAPSANTNVGLEIFNGAAASSFSDGPLWVYNYSTDKWGASIQGSETTLDNVTAMKFDRTLTGLATDNADIADLYGGNSSAVSNDTTARSLGGVSRCRITITTEAQDGVSNFAPVTAAAVGYPIAHNLGTKAVFVVAIKDPDGTPIPVFCKYQPKTTNVAVVSVGITAEDEVYDIIVIG